MNYYQIRSKRLLKAYAYDKRKKELNDVRKDKTDNKERCEEKTAATEL